MVTLDGKQRHDSFKTKIQIGIGGGTLARSVIGAALVSTLTPNEEVATDNKHHSDGSQHESGPVPVVFVAHEADPAHGVSVHLWWRRTRA